MESLVQDVTLCGLSLKKKKKDTDGIPYTANPRPIEKANHVPKFIL